jgi:hypothetical protein
MWTARERHSRSHKLWFMGCGVCWAFAVRKLELGYRPSQTSGPDREPGARLRFLTGAVPRGRGRASILWLSQSAPQAISRAHHGAVRVSRPLASGPRPAPHCCDARFIHQSWERSPTEECTCWPGALEECQIHSSMEVSLQVSGQIQEMHPIVRDEVYRIVLPASWASFQSRAPPVPVR